MKKYSFFIFLMFLLNSCATILNGKTTSVKISADKTSKIIFKKDTISINRQKTTIWPIRSTKPLKITVLKDSLQQDFSFNKKISATTLLNIYNYGIGLIPDIITKKAFRYSNNLHFITDTLTNKIVLSNKKITFVPQKKLFIYTSPLKPFDFFSIPMATLGLEYFVKNNISLSAEYGALLPNIKLNRHNISYLEEKAFNYRLEAKWYNAINLTKNVHLNEYLGFEVRNINSQYNDYITYYENDNISERSIITDDFATKKRVTVINLKYGLLLPIGNKFYFDFYTGLGLRIKRFDHINLEYDKAIHRFYDDSLPGFDVRDFKNYNRKNLLNFSLGCKFGINF
ncbi:hypothetical protein [uncultured Polaribacter sp.]|uniref:hypothetical protein n=1 Tax=uncultured Polaribacter sp. TaxID=174711 RepID=UPI0026391D62|nr:hypothetical protein [uncultured Polaribacter sp.]